MMNRLSFPHNFSRQTLFNPNKTVVKMFVVMYDLSDMPANSQTFLRQRTMYMPTGKNGKGEKVTKDHLETFLRYLIHLRSVGLFLR